MNYNFPRWMVDDLEKSAIEIKPAYDMGFRYVDASKLHDYLGFTPRDAHNNPIDGYIIPFVDPETDKPMTCADGKRPYVRVKLHVPAVDRNGKPAKYLSPKDAGQHAYIQPKVHAYLVNNVDVALSFTEGEKKSIKATLAGMPTIGLTGNHGWNITRNEKKELLPELKRYIDHKTWIAIYDSDAASNPDFRNSLIDQVKVLAEYDIDLYVVFLPNIGNGKVGLDDYLTIPGNSIESLKAYVEKHKTLVDPVMIGWPDIDPSRINFQPLPEFPIDAVPDPLKDQIIEAAKCYQVPIDFPAIMAFCIAGIAIGGRTIVSPKRGVVARANLYAAVFMKTGERKSSVFTPMNQPLELFQSQHLDEWKEFQRVRRRWQNRVDGLERELAKPLAAEKRRLHEEELKSLEQSEPVGISPLILCENITEEALAAKMSETDERAAVFSPDARDVLQVIAGLYDAKGQNRDTIYLKSHDGDPHMVDRMSRIPIHLKKPCIGMCLCAQLDKLQDLGGNQALHDSGFIPRLIMVVPNSRVGTRMYDEAEIHQSTQNRYNQFILSLLEHSRNETETVYVQLSAEAKMLWIEYYNIIETELTSQYKTCVGNAVRYPSLALRFSLIIARCEGHQQITAGDMTKALTLTDYFTHHIGRALSVFNRQLTPALKKIVDYIKSHNMREFSLGDLRRRMNQQQDWIHEHVQQLVELGYLRYKNKPKGSNVTPIYEANPRIWMN